MFSSIARKARTLVRMDWANFRRRMKKQLLMYAGYYRSKLLGRKFWKVVVDGVHIKLSFATPYHHLYAHHEHNGGHESMLLAEWKKEVEKMAGGVIFDVGAYNGIYGLVAAKANPRVHVVMFEVDPINVAHIQNNIALNNLSNAEVVPKALSEASGTLYWSEHRGGSSGHLVEKKTPHPVEAISISDWSKEHGKVPALMKFDIHGAEYGALFASREILSRTPTTIFLELYPESPEKEAAFWELFKNLGYTALHRYERADRGANYYRVYKPI